MTAKQRAGGGTSKLAGYSLVSLRRLLRAVRIGLAMPPDTAHRTGER